jgi:hypothetical protein
LCEFKPGNNKSILKKQQGKNLRLNQATSENLKTINVDDAIVAMNWGGKCVLCLITISSNDITFY